MRVINEVLTFPRTVVEQKLAVEERIIKREDDRQNKFLLVTTELFDREGVKLTERHFQIFASDYDFLLSEALEFSPGKPKNDYRTEDLFLVIDLIRER